MPSTIGIVASGAPNFTPADLSPILWLDASDSSTITSSSGSVSEWRDKSGTGNNVTQATSTRQPTTGSTTQNGLNVISFDTTDGLVGSSNSAFNSMHNGTTNLIGIVAKSTSNETRCYVATHGGGSNKRGFYFYRLNTGALLHTVSTGTGTTRASLNQTSSSVVGTTTELLTVLADADASTASARSSIFRRGGSAISNNTFTNAPSTSDATDPLGVGALSESGTLYDSFNGFIAEIVIVSGANATDANRVKLRDYLNTKWAVY